MGKKSKEKKERRKEELLSKPEAPTNFLVEFLRYGFYLVLFTPLVLGRRFYFPFVGPKSLYLMAGAEILFFVWLFLAIYHKKYRPKLTTISLAFILFLSLLTLSSIWGVDFSNSFWSKFERMTGVLMWLHLFCLFLVISSTFQKVSDWSKIFSVSVFIAALVSVAALFERAGIQNFKFSDRGGATLGNTSFLGIYLLFNAFLALWMFFQKRNLAWRVYSSIVLVLSIITMYAVDARAATFSFLGGLFLLFILWLAFYPKNSRNIKILGKVLLVISTVAFLVSVVLLFVPESFVQKKFIALTTWARVVNWRIAWKGFLEKPILGWGPENYLIAFTKFFNPCLFIPECGGEIWFDRTHNIVLDSLVTIGVAGFLSYLGLFITFLAVLWKRYLREKVIDFWTFGIFTVLPIAYFVQNLTVFDMATSLMMFILILAFGAFLAKIGEEMEEKEKEKRFIKKSWWMGLILFFVFCLTFLNLVVKPFIKDNLVIEALMIQGMQEKIDIYQRIFKISPLGKYQINEFIGQNFGEYLKENTKTLSSEQVKKGLDFVLEELEKTKRSSPLEYRVTLRLAHLYNFYVTLDSQKLPLAEKYGEESISLSPTNQQGYWVLAQTRVYQSDFDNAMNLAQRAIDLEPRLFQSHQIAVQIAKIFDKTEKAKELIEKAARVNPDWQKQLEDLLQQQ